jgi:hypothetical protein
VSRRAAAHSRHLGDPKAASSFSYLGHTPLEFSLGKSEKPANFGVIW